MKLFLSQLRGAIVSTVILAVVCCGLYPLAVTALARVCWPHEAEGGLITETNGVVRGSVLIGQQFSSEKYFHSRPSSAGNGYDATSSSGSNLGPTSSNLSTTITQRVTDYRAENKLAGDAPVPADAVTASGSGLDPHISPRNAALQAPRVARARNLPLENVQKLILASTDQPGLGFLGDPGVNVLALNLALDRVK